MKKANFIPMLFAFAIGMIQSIAVAQKTSNTTPLTPQLLAKLKKVSSAEISPNGEWVAYTLSVPRKLGTANNGRNWSEIHVLNTASGESRPFVTGEVTAGRVQWSHDSKSIFYLSQRFNDRNTSLYRIPVDGGESQRVVEHITAISDYHWSANGTQLAFLAKRAEQESSLKQKEMGFNAEIYEENLSPTQVWVKLPNNRNPRMLELEGSATLIQWSPDGSKLMVVLTPTPLIDHKYMYQKIHVVDPESGKILSSIDNVGKLARVQWSPEGDKIAYTGGEDINDPTDGCLYVVDWKRGKPQRLLEDYLPTIDEIIWMDNSNILLTAYNGCESDLVRVNIDESQRTIVSPASDPILDSLSYSAESNTAVFVASTFRHPTEVFSIKMDGESDFVRLTNSNSWLDGIKFGKQEVIEWTANDGERIEGVLIYPANYKKSKRYPLIVSVHGGPESQRSDGWLTRYSSPGQIGAGEDYFVLYPNYRGSTGRGVAFAKAHQGDYGGKEFDDIIAGIDYLEDLKLIHPKKVGVTGGSYGGYASAWMATRHTKRIAASVMFAGISNKISKFGTTDIPDEMHLVHARKRVWDDWQFFLERSPIYYAEKCETPILILHGKEDPRVHPSQSLELYRHLKVLGKTPVRLVLYPGEGHGNRKIAAQYDYSLRLMRWMNHYLKGKGGEAPNPELDYGIEGTKVFR